MVNTPKPILVQKKAPSRSVSPDEILGRTTVATVGVFQAINGHEHVVPFWNAPATNGTHTEQTAIDSFVAMYLMTPLTRIALIKGGVPAHSISVLAKAMRWAKDDVLKALHLSSTTVDRKTRNNANLSGEQSEGVIGMAKLIGQVQAIVEQSGNPSGFDAARWVGQWLHTPLQALGGVKPAEYMDTAEGRDMLAQLISTAQSGAYA